MMQIPNIKKLLGMLLICSLCIGGEKENSQAMSINSVVKHCKKVYYGTQSNLKKYTRYHVKGEYTDYYDKKKKVLRKAITYPTAKTDAYIKKYTAEYFYDSKQRLVFAFAYRKVNGKVKEYRAYYGTDRKLYRYINESGKVFNYSKGRNIDTDSNSLKYQLYNKGTYYLHLALE